MIRTKRTSRYSKAELISQAKNSNKFKGSNLASLKTEASTEKILDERNMIGGPSFQISDVLNQSLDSNYTEEAELTRKKAQKKAKFSKKNVKIEEGAYGIGSRKTAKDDATLMVLRYYYTESKLNPGKNNIPIGKICSETGLSKRQVYKWMWDEQKRGGKAQDLDLEEELDELNRAKYGNLSKFKAKKGHFQRVCTGIKMPEQLKNCIPEHVLEGLRMSVFASN